MINMLQTVFIAGFIIFLMELGDKTQIAAFALSARFRRPWTVFAGVLTGLCLVSLIAVLIGSFLSGLMSSSLLPWLLGAVFVIVGVVTVFNAQKPALSPEEFIKHCPVPQENCPHHKSSCMSRPEECPVFVSEVLGKGAFSKSLTIIFAAEIGDKTWITVLILATQFDPIGVLFGAMAGFALVNGMAIMLGHQLADKIPKKKLDIAVGVSLIVVGLTLLLFHS